MIEVHAYGATGPRVLVLHGGPGAPGYMAPVATRLADSFRVLEPLQRCGGSEPLTVARHIADLHEVVVARCEGFRPVLVGHSWGAMLALAFAAAYPGVSGPIALVGCGTFDPASRNAMHRLVARRTDAILRRRLDRLAQQYPDPDERFQALGNLMLPIFSCDLDTAELVFQSGNHRAFEETWQDMLRLQAEGIYPAAFRLIQSPVIMLHGAIDPHPGRMICKSLQTYIPQLEYQELTHCGHYPWLEKAARDPFFRLLRHWIMQHLIPYAQTCPANGGGYP